MVSDPTPVSDDVNLFFGNRYTKSPIWIVMTFPDLLSWEYLRGPLPNGYILGTCPRCIVHQAQPAKLSKYQRGYLRVKKYAVQLVKWEHIGPPNLIGG